MKGLFIMKKRLFALLLVIIAVLSFTTVSFAAYETSIPLSAQEIHPVLYISNVRSHCPRLPRIKLTLFLRSVRSEQKSGFISIRQLQASVI